MKRTRPHRRTVSLHRICSKSNGVSVLFRLLRLHEWQLGHQLQIDH